MKHPIVRTGVHPKPSKPRPVGLNCHTPRGHASTCEPQIIKKYQICLTDEPERKIIALFAPGNSYQDIRAHIADRYDISLSNGTLNAVTDKLLLE